MATDYRQMKREVERLERELETPISSERRRAVQAAINHLRRKISAAEKPH